jgi:hypothetical protein
MFIIIYGIRVYDKEILQKDGAGKNRFVFALKIGFLYEKEYYSLSKGI